MGRYRQDGNQDDVQRTVSAFGDEDGEGEGEGRRDGQRESLLPETAPRYSSTAPLPPGDSTPPPTPLNSPMPTPTGGEELPSLIEPKMILVGKYQVIRKLGEGGMGSVWLVEHLGLGGQRALKVIRREAASDPGVRRRFRQEAKILDKLKHPNAVVVHDTAVVGQGAYIEMEYLEGQSLRDVLKAGQPMQVPTVIWMLERICDVLNRAHALGIVHRDLKPENIMIVHDPVSGTPELKVLDFGIAKIVQHDGDPSSNPTMNTEGLLGTPAYSSPEQNDVDPDTKHRLPIDGRSDIYSVGVILYEMLTGLRPFKGRNYAQLLYQHANVEPPRFAEVAPGVDVPEAMEAVVRQCLAKDPAQRPRTARELFESFKRAVEEMDTAERQKTAAPPSLEPSPSPRLLSAPAVAERTADQPAGWLHAVRARWRAGLVGLAAVLAAAAGVAWIRGFGDGQQVIVEPPPPPPPPPPSVARIDEFLGRNKLRAEDGAERTPEGWPRVVKRSSGEPRTLYLHGKVYLPEGYEPESGKAGERAPGMVKDRYGARFVFIPGDEFMMGALDEGPMFEDSERPSHLVRLSPYYIQENETTIEQFDRFCLATDRGPNDPEVAMYNNVRKALVKDAGGSDEDIRRRPASGVSHRLATAYARAMGGELPSEAQWEFAARSAGQSRSYFIWGNSDDPAVVKTKANLNDDWEDRISSRDVGSSGDRTRQGVHDLAGNVREWCRDVWAPYAESGKLLDPVIRAEGKKNPKFVIRGGSYFTPLETARVTFRNDNAKCEYKARDTESFEDVGFRVVLEVLDISNVSLAEAGKADSGR